MPIMPGRAREDMYLPIRCVGEGEHRDSCSAEEVCVDIVDMVHARVLRSVHIPRRWTRGREESLGAAVSPIRNPIRASLASVDGVEGVFMTYSVPLHRILLWTRKGAVSG